jgi:transposase-like protein/transcription elongation factor Elf1
MKYEPPKFEDLSQMSAIDVQRLTEEEAREMLEKVRWPNQIACPHCGGINITRLEAKAESVRDGLIQCNDCRQQFTVMVGTIMQGSHITLRQWVQAFHAMCASKKGVSALQLQRNLGIHSYKCAWHLAHRIRLAMKMESLTPTLKGTVEVDETYIGGKPKKVDEFGKPIKNKRGRGTKKTPVVALISRRGNMATKVVDTVNAKNLKEAINENVSKRATLMTDELPAYNRVGYKKHKSVNHSEGEYSKDGVNVNSCESFFALLKRGIHGTFHHISKTHLQRYCNEFSFRWNNRKVTDGERMVEAVKGAWGKRLTYKPLIQGA